MGLSHHFSTVDRNQPRLNRLLLASRFPMTRIETDGLLAESGRWLHVRIHNDMDLDLALMHVPNRDKTGVKYAFHDAVVKELAPLASRSSIALGDTNTGIPKLDESAPFFNAREGQWFENLEAAGWIDCFRQFCPDELVETWRSQSGSRFRLDQAFVTESLLPRVVSMTYDWGLEDPVTGKSASDHAAILLDLVTHSGHYEV
jgi:exonuclease III